MLKNDTLRNGTSYIGFYGSAPREYFTLSDTLPTVKSNTTFGKISLIGFEKYYLEIDENLVYLCFGLA